MYHNSLYTDEIQSSVYQEDSHVMDYIAYLKCYYKAQFTHPGSDEKWPNIQIDRYIELSIAKDCQFSRENALQFSLSSVKKGIDELVSKKETIGLRGIACLHANGAPRKGVLIIGAPAIGKTSLVRRLCLGWAQGELLQHYDMVILLQLRDSYLITAKIGEIFDPENPTNGVAIFEEMKRKNGERVLIIFDGYDEAPAELKNSNCVVKRLLDWRSLPKATVLITSRPAATDKLARDGRFEQKLEVLGFTKRNILQYAKEYFLKEKKPPQKTGKFQRYLEMHPHIFAMMYNPLHCAIVTEAYSFNLAHGLPIHTMTDLYTNLTLSLLSRYSSVEHTSYDQLPDNVADKFWRLAKLAYDYYKKRNFVFSDVPEDLIELGFFKSFPRMYIHKDASSCHIFLHLTVQEYLTALHASKCNSTQNQITTIHNIEYMHDSSTNLFFAGLTQSLSHVTELTVEHDIVPFLFEIHSPDKINSVLSSSDRTLLGLIDDPFSSYSVGYVLAVTHCKWEVHMFNITADIVHCFCCGFEAGGGQCDPEQISNFGVDLTSPNDYHCMLKLPQNFLENVVEFKYLHHEHSYVDLNLLCKIWKKMSRLETVIMLSSNISANLFSKNDILSISIICSSLQNTKISMYAKSIVFYTQLTRAAVCFFQVKSIVGRYFTTYYTDHYNMGTIVCMFCSKLPLTVLLEDLSWFADMSYTALEDHAHNYWYNPYTHQECLSVVNLTAHLTTITITSTLHCPQSTVALLYHILLHNLLPCTVTSLNLTHTSSTIVHHLLPALSHNHQLICWRITDCSLFLRTRSSPIPPVKSIKKDISSSRLTTDSLSNSTSSYTSLTVKLTLYILIFVFFLILFHLL